MSSPGILVCVGCSPLDSVRVTLRLTLPPVNPARTKKCWTEIILVSSSQRCRVQFHRRRFSARRMLILTTMSCVVPSGSLSPELGLPPTSPNPNSSFSRRFLLKKNDWDCHKSAMCGRTRFLIVGFLIYHRGAGRGGGVPVPARASMWKSFTFLKARAHCWNEQGHTESSIKGADSWQEWKRPCGGEEQTNIIAAAAARAAAFT